MPLLMAVGAESLFHARTGRLTFYEHRSREEFEGIQTLVHHQYRDRRADASAFSLQFFLGVHLSAVGWFDLAGLPPGCGAVSVYRIAPLRKIF